MPPLLSDNSTYCVGLICVENNLTKGRKFHKRNAREEKWRMGEKEIDRLWNIKSAQQKKVGRLELLGDYKGQRSHGIITSNEPRRRPFMEFQNLTKIAE